jgi:aryl-alcohol dehydrogenase-like predicted oxidoreductase
MLPSTSCTSYTLSASVAGPLITAPVVFSRHRCALRWPLEESLRRLQTYYVDLYWLHGWDRRAPIEETLRALDDLVAAGKVRYVGFSDVPAWVAAQAQTIARFRGWAPITALQLEYSLLERTSEGELLPMAEALGMGVLPWSPLRGGQLSGKYVRNGGAPADTMRPARGNGPTERGWVVIEAVARVAAEIGVGSAEVALAWVRSRPAVTSTLIGARTIEQLRANLTSLEITLTPEQLAALDEPSTPSLDFPAAITAGQGPVMGFGERPWTASSSRYGRCCSPTRPAIEFAEGACCQRTSSDCGRK